MKGSGCIGMLFSGALIVFSATSSFALKDQSRLPASEEVDKPGTGLGTTPLVNPGATPDLLQVDPSSIVPAPEGSQKPENSGEPEAIPPVIQVVKTIELTPDIAKRAVDGFVKLKEAYQDTDIAEYETLEEFVANAKEGPALEKDIKSYGFETVGDWNTAVTSVSFAYAAVVGTQEDEIKQEIENIQNETELEESLRKSLIDGLRSMLPSDNNKKVVAEMNKEPAWAEKLKLLTEEPAGEH